MIKIDIEIDKNDWLKKNGGLNNRNEKKKAGATESLNINNKINVCW